MAKAHQAPPKAYERKLYISRHALERLRERLTAQASELAAYDDEHLGNKVDECVTDKLRNAAFRIVYEKGIKTQLVDLDDWLGWPLVALVRENEGVNARAVPLALVTVLTPEHVERSLARGNFRLEPPQTTKATLASVSGLAALRDKLPATRAAPKPDGELVASLVRLALGAPVPAAPPLDTVLVTWVTESGAVICEEVPRGEVGDLSVRIVRAGVDPASIRVWREIKTRMRIEIEE